LLVVICTAGCERKVTSAPREAYWAGYIFSDKQPKVTRDFTVRNPSTETVRILKIERSCACASFSLEKFALAPGEATKLTINVDVPRTYLQKSASCILKTDHPRFKDWVYAVEFVSLPFIVADPEALNLGSFSVDGRGLDAVQHATLDVFADQKVELTDHNFVVPEEIELNVSPAAEARRLQAGVWDTRYQIAVRLSKKGREVVIHSSLSGLTTKTIKVTARESTTSRWQYSVYWQMSPPLEGHPSYLAFGNLMDDSDPHSASVTISSTTSEQFRIVSIESQSREIQVDATVDSPDMALQHRLRFRAKGRMRPGGSAADEPRRLLSGTIHVRTTGTVRPILEIFWSATLDRSAKVRPQEDRPKSSSEPRL
jgi:hypothetical protein